MSIAYIAPPPRKINPCSFLGLLKNFFEWIVPKMRINLSSFSLSRTLVSPSWCHGFIIRTILQKKIRIKILIDFLYGSILPFNNPLVFHFAKRIYKKNVPKRTRCVYILFNVCVYYLQCNINLWPKNKVNTIIDS